MLARFWAGGKCAVCHFAIMRDLPSPFSPCFSHPATLLHNGHRHLRYYHSLFKIASTLEPTLQALYR